MAKIERMLSPENLIERRNYRFKLHAGSQVEMLDGRFEKITVLSDSIGVLVKNIHTDSRDPPVFIPWVRVIACTALN
jgi:hypothetical protein